MVRAAVVGISEAEHREIDAAAAEQQSRAERVEQLGAYVDTIHPDRLLDIAASISRGDRIGPPLPPQSVAEAPYQEEPAPNIFTTPVGLPEWVGSVDEAPRTPEPDLSPPEPEDEPMAVLTDIMGALAQAGTIYQSFQQQPAPFPAAQAPYQGSWRDWIDGPMDVLAPSGTPPTPTTSLPGGTMALPYAGGCISRRDQEIAAASGLSPEAVDRVLYYARKGRRRRKRMLTKSDIGDISTMRQILGGGKAFDVWLAKATR